MSPHTVVSECRFGDAIVTPNGLVSPAMVPPVGLLVCLYTSPYKLPKSAPVELLRYAAPMDQMWSVLDAS
ncbi:hypothetical protein [Vibrio penaeicida]|uniref:hypothetical protein n=1 Tax=Vibrio penaeicida TaxID=104609 RepID=UPI001CC36160|nr:hypothetical protein [Vibrio penaeicida]